MSFKRYYTVKEFAGEMQVHSNTIYKGIKHGKIMALKLTNGKNSSYRIPSSEFQRIAHIDLETVFSEMQDVD